MKNKKEIEALEFAIEVLQKKIEKLKGGDANIASKPPIEEPGKDPLPPDPTHP